MTREEAMIILDGFKNNPLFSDTHAQAFDMAISALSENKGEWILDYRDCGVEFYHCSECKSGRAVIDGDYYKSLDEFKKCPNCGADMRGET